MRLDTLDKLDRIGGGGELFDVNSSHLLMLNRE